MSVDVVSGKSPWAPGAPRIRRLAERYTHRHSAAYLVTHAGLLWRVTLSELRARYAGSLLGIGWALIAPLSILGVYAVVYLVIFPFQPEGLTSFEYVLYIFAGLVPFLALAEALGAGIGSVVTSRSLLGNVVFPIDLAPAKAVLAAQAPMVAGVAILVLGTAATGQLSWTALLVPILWAFNVLGALGVIWFLSLLNIVLRDLQNLVNVVVIMLLIASPIAYTPEMVPTGMKWLILLNPFAYFVIAYQKLFLLGELPSLFQCAVIVGLSIGSIAAGGWFFARAKRVLLDYV